MEWIDVINDPSLRNLTYKIELDELGRIVICPASNRHGIQQGKLIRLLSQILYEGELATECSISTHLGVKVADVVWISSEFLARYGDQTPYPQAPELCVEIRSPSKSDKEIEEKIRLYLGYGALEVWVVSSEGVVTPYGPEGKRDHSLIPGAEATHCL
jgi:Uma2 family endonuclease